MKQGAPTLTGTACSSVETEETKWRARANDANGDSDGCAEAMTSTAGAFSDPRPCLLRRLRR